MSGPRIATVHLPRFGLQVATRRRPELRRSPLAVASAGGDRIVECSRQAAAEGVVASQTVARARLSCPGLIVLPPDPDGRARARREVLEALLLVGPRVSWVGAGTFQLDATGLAGLHGGERGLLLCCGATVDDLGFVPRLGMADTRFASLLAARSRGGPTVVPAGGDRRFLAPWPLDLLPLDVRLRERLRLLGVSDLGGFARLPAGGVTDRFGREAARCQLLARGEDPEPLVGEEVVAGPSVSRELDDPIDGMEPVTFLLKSCCQELSEALARRGTGAARVEVCLLLDGAGVDRRLIEPSRPLTSPRALLDLCRIELDARPVSAPIVGLRMTAEREADATPSPGRLFDRAPATAELESAIDRVRTLLGPTRVVTPRPRDAHRREARIAWEPFDLRRRRKLHPADEGREVACPTRTERVLARPLPVLVKLPDRAGMKGSLVVPSPGPGLPGRTSILKWWGPHRISGEWWDGGADVDRDEYLLLGEDGGIYRTARDRRTRRWVLLAVED